MGTLIPLFWTSGDVSSGFQIHLEIHVDSNCYVVVYLRDRF